VATTELPGTSSASPTTGSQAGVLARRPGRAEVDPKGHARRGKVRDLGLGIGVPVALVLLWQVASTRGWIDRRLFPSPTDTLSEARRLLENGQLLDNLWVSVRRIVLGFVIGSAAGIGIGLLMGVIRPVRAAFEPLLNALYTVPKLAILPVYLIIFGFGEKPIVALIATTVFFFVWISTLASISAVPEGYLDAALALRVTRWELFRHVLLPASLPQIFVGLRVAAGVSVLVMVGVEFVIGDRGIGYLIEQGRSLLLLGQTYVGIVIAALMGLVFTWIVKRVGRLVAPWAKDDTTAGRV
jgi:sulfonate transport system permease protein